EEDLVLTDGLGALGEDGAEARRGPRVNADRRIERVGEARRRRRNGQRVQLAGERAVEGREVRLKGTIEVGLVRGVRQDQAVGSVEIWDQQRELILGASHRRAENQKGRESFQFVISVKVLLLSPARLAINRDSVDQQIVGNALQTECNRVILLTL